MALALLLHRLQQRLQRATAEESLGDEATITVAMTVGELRQWIRELGGLA